jgi:hypothetical protein
LEHREAHIDRLATIRDLLLGIIESESSQLGPVEQGQFEISLSPDDSLNREAIAGVQEILTEIAPEQETVIRDMADTLLNQINHLDSSKHADREKIETAIDDFWIAVGEFLERNSLLHFDEIFELSSVFSHKQTIREALQSLQLLVPESTFTHMLEYECSLEDDEEQ